MVRRLSAALSGIILIVITGCTSLALKTPSETKTIDSLEQEVSLAKANVNRLKDDLFQVIIELDYASGELERLENSYTNLTRLP